MARQKRIGLTGDEEFCLCGYLATGDSSTAYRLAMKSTSEDTLNLQKMASRWLNRSECQEFIKIRQSANLTKAEETAYAEGSATRKKNRDRLDLITDLNILADAETDPRKKADILMRIAEIERMKQEAAVEDEKRVTFYIPLTINRSLELLAYHLKNEFGWDAEKQKRAIEVMTKAMHNEPIEAG